MPPSLSSDCCSNHVVQFYLDDSFLLDELSGLVTDALKQRNAAVVIATQAHREQLAQRLQQQGYDTSAAIQERRLITLDTSETLSKFMVNGLPDAARFRNVVGEVVGKAIAAAQGAPPQMVAFGEMVAQLWASGNDEAAIQLEQLWNELCRNYGFSLRCGYPLSNFSGVDHAESLAQICAQHSAVIPDESYTYLRSQEERVRAITQLQQKARVLETEAAERTRVQGKLVASQAALQVSHAELERKVQERTRELVGVQEALRLLTHRLLTIRDEERRKLALELHDTTSQVLTALQMSLAALEQAEKESDPGRASRLHEPFKLADQAMRQVRRLSYRLHPPLLEEPGLQFALRWYVAGFVQQTGISVQLDVAQDLQRFSHQLELAIFRIVEEGLDNVHRHSGSRVAQVCLSVRESAIQLKIEDAGRGIDWKILKGSQAELFRLGAGITGMIERVNQLGGEISVSSANPGTSIAIRLPIAGAMAAFPGESAATTTG
jgi:signal transduction histidine kinase